MSATIGDSGQKHQIHPNSLANLRTAPPWEPGKSPNPGGNHRGTPKISNAIDRLLALSPEELASFVPANVAEAAALVQVKNSINGKPLKALPSTREILDRTEGKSRQSVDVTASVVNVNVQVNLFLDAAADLAARHSVPLELAQARMLAIAEPAQRAAIEAALAAANPEQR